LSQDVVHLDLFGVHNIGIGTAKMACVIKAKIVEYHDVPVIVFKLGHDVACHIVVYNLGVQHIKRRRTVTANECRWKELEPGLIAKHEDSSACVNSLGHNVVVLERWRVQVGLDVQKPGDRTRYHCFYSRQRYGGGVRAGDKRECGTRGYFFIDKGKARPVLPNEIRAKRVHQHNHYALASCRIAAADCGWLHDVVCRTRGAREEGRKKNGSAHQSRRSAQKIPQNGIRWCPLSKHPGCKVRA
jgi:hypothetical protein